MSSRRGRKSSSADVEAAARFTEFGELDMPRFQVGFPPQHLLLTLIGDYWSGRCEALPSAALVDLLAEFEAGTAPSLVGLASLRSELSELLGVTADLVEHSAMRPAVRVAAERDAIRVF